MVWGNNVVLSNPDCYKGEPFSSCVNMGSKLIAIDPRLTRIAARADIWLKLRPGTDTALALGMLNVIVNEGLYDKAFVEKHVHGWGPFVDRVNEYPLERVEQITWVRGVTEGVNESPVQCHVGSWFKGSSIKSLYYLEQGGRNDETR